MSKETYVTPIIKVQYAHIKEPDTTFSGKGREYKLDGIFERSNPEHIECFKFMKSLAPENMNQPIHKKPSEDSDYVLVRFKQAETIVAQDGKTYSNFQPVVFDSQGRKMNEVPLIGNGSKIRVRYRPHPYDYSKRNKNGKVGVRLQPVAIQIVELVEYVAEEPKAQGFDAVDGGYTPPVEENGFNAVPTQVQSDTVMDSVPPSDGFEPEPQQQSTGMPDFEDF